MLAANFSVLQVSDKSNTICTAKSRYVTRQLYHYAVAFSTFWYLPFASDQLTTLIDTYVTCNSTLTRVTHWLSVAFGIYHGP